MDIVIYFSPTINYKYSVNSITKIDKNIYKIECNRFIIPFNEPADIYLEFKNEKIHIETFYNINNINVHKMKNYFIVKYDYPEDFKEKKETILYNVEYSRLEYERWQEQLKRIKNQPKEIRKYNKDLKKKTKELGKLVKKNNYEYYDTSSCILWNCINIDNYDIPIKINKLSTT